MSQNKSIGMILTSKNSGLDSLLDRVAVLHMLNTLLTAILDDPLRRHIQIANIRKETLVIGADTSAWLSRVRYLAPAILKQLKQDAGLDFLTRIEFKVMPNLTEQFQKPPRSIHLTRRSAEQIKSAAEGTPDPKLRAALKRLARRN